ncbi:MULTISPECIES: hypothetical protein [Phenylobacterium]|uniref:DUF1631 domain-containing protein n=1 Tax=Phenylobacterium koreense TaxID=266125 RepID=A0ABV2EEI9_9CAUL
MAGLSDDKIDIVRGLVAAAPDKVVSGLQNALATAGGDTALAGVRRLVEAEIGERILRNKVLEPVAPLFRSMAVPSDTLVFAPAAFPLLWRGLRAVASDEAEHAALILHGYEPGVTSAEPFDLLTDRLADEIDAKGQPDIVAALKILDEARPGASASLRTCLSIAPIVRRATMKLPDWIVRTTQERATAARIAYRDACRGGEDRGPLFFEMLAGQLAEPWTILRIVSAVMDKPAESYMAGSELASFAVRLMDAVDLGVKALAGFDLQDGEAAAVEAARAVEVLTLQISELESNIELARDGVWGARIQKQKQVFATTVERRVRELPKLINAALPSQRVRTARAMVSEPRLDARPDPQQVEACRSLLAFIEGVRASANHGGFASARSQVIEKAAEALDEYVEEVLDAVRDGAAPHNDIAEHLLEAAAEFIGRLREPRAGDIVRRRAAAAFAVVAPRRRGGSFLAG